VQRLVALPVIVLGLEQGDRERLAGGGVVEKHESLGRNTGWRSCLGLDPGANFGRTLGHRRGIGAFEASDTCIHPILLSSSLAIRPYSTPSAAWRGCEGAALSTSRLNRRAALTPPARAGPPQAFAPRTGPGPRTTSRPGSGGRGEAGRGGARPTQSAGS